MLATCWPKCEDSIKIYKDGISLGFIVQISYLDQSGKTKKWGIFSGGGGGGGGRTKTHVVLRVGERERVHP